MNRVGGGAIPKKLLKSETNRSAPGEKVMKMMNAEGEI